MAKGSQVNSKQQQQQQQKIETGSVTKHGVGKLDRGNQKDKRETLPL